MYIPPVALGETIECFSTELIWSTEFGGSLKKPTKNKHARAKIKTKSLADMPHVT